MPKSTKKNKSKNKAILPISDEVKQLEQYASDLNPQETLASIRSVSKRKLKWMGAPGELFLEPKERLALEAALIQNIERFNRSEFFELLSWLEKAKVHFGTLKSHVRTGLLFSLQQYLPDCDHDEIFNLVLLLSGLGLNWDSMVPTEFLFLFAQKLDEQICNMDADQFVKVLKELNQMRFKWRELKVVYDEQRVDLRESIATNMVDRYNSLNVKDKMDILEMLNKMGYIKGHLPDKMEDLCFMFLTSCIREFVGSEQAKKIWLLYKNLKFEKEDIGKNLHSFLKKYSGSTSTASPASKTRHSRTRRKSSRLKKKSPTEEQDEQPAQHESPHPYHDYEKRR